MLADQLTAALLEHLPHAHIARFNLRTLASDIGEAQVVPAFSNELKEALETVEHAEALIAVTPTYKGSYSGLFKAFFDLLPEGALKDVPVTVAATGGTARHSLMLDHSLRPLFGYFRARVLPTAVFATTEDWGHSGLAERIERSGTELAQFLSGQPRPSTSHNAINDGAAQPMDFTPFEELLKG